MPTITRVVGTRTSLTATGLSTLASGTYVASSIYTPPSDPDDVLIEVELASTNAPASDKLCNVWVQCSLDGTNFTSGPTSGTTTTDEPDLMPLGPVWMNTITTTHRAIFSLMDRIGFVPDTLKVVVRNQIGVALTSGAIYTSAVTRVF